MARRAVAPGRKFHVTAVHVGSLTINENQLKWEKTYFQDLTMAKVKMASNSLGPRICMELCWCVCVQPAVVSDTIFQLDFTAGNDSYASLGTQLFGSSPAV